MIDVRRWRLEIERLDRIIEPVAKQGVDIFSPDFVKKTRFGANPLDLAGIRADCMNLLRDMIHAYETDGDDSRIEIRKLFKEAPSFRWAANLPVEPMSASSLQAWLMLFSIKDQEDDPRDAILELQTQVSRARANGINVVPLLKAAASLSSTENLYGMESTRSIIEQQIRDTSRCRAAR